MKTVEEYKNICLKINGMLNNEELSVFEATAVLEFVKLGLYCISDKK